MKALGRLIIISTVIVVCSNFAQGQVEPWSGFESSALLFSQTTYGGSARVQGLGNAFTALGGDVTSASMNPAGLGFYNRSEISFTPAVTIQNMTSDYLGNQTTDGKTNFNISNLGLVFNNTRLEPTEEGWMGGNWGISFNRTNNFNNRTFYEGENKTNDFVDWVLDESNFIQENYLTDLSYDAYLINDYEIYYDYNPTGDTVYVGEVLTVDTPEGPVDLEGRWGSFVSYTSPDNPTWQLEEIDTKGAQNQWNFSYGGNFSDRFYFGASLGISTIRYESDRIYREYRGGNDILDELVISEKLRIDGVGVNGTFGIIVRPVNVFTIGVSYVTPTVYSVEDELTSTMNTVWRNSAFDYYGDDAGFSGDQLATGQTLASTYSLRTPQKVNVGLSVFVGKHGFISADVEWIDYSRMSYSSLDLNFDYENENIRSLYKSVVNIRVGGEYRNGILRLRGGYQYQGDPYNDVDDISRIRNVISAGPGLRIKNFYTDFTFLYSFYNSIQSPYTIDPEAVEYIGPTPVAEISNSVSSLIFSLGFFF